MRVYHFLSATHAVSNITLGRIRISRFGDLNDPFELLAVKSEDRQFRMGLRSWREDFDRVWGLLCFSRDWHNPVLWSHYGDKHRGMCLGFELKDSLAQSVSYVSERIPVKFTDNEPAQGLDKTFVRQLLLTKYEHWRYEDEVRVLVKLNPKHSEAGSYFYPFGAKLAFRDVILGPRCELAIDELRRTVQATYGKAASVTKARLAFKRFAVVYDERSVKDENAFRRG